MCSPQKDGPAWTASTARGLSGYSVPPPSAPAPLQVGKSVAPAGRPAAAPLQANTPSKSNNTPSNSGRVESTAPSGVSVSQRFVDYLWSREGRFDKNGNIMPYALPSNDGGAVGSDNIEVAGMTPRYNKAERDQLLQMIKSGKSQQEIKAEFAKMVEKKTAAATKFSSDPVIQEMVRDIIYHRGEGGARKIFEIAFGKDGPKGLSTEAQIDRLTDAALKYEIDYANLKGRPNLEKGLRNRFELRRNFALELAKKQKPKPGQDGGPYYASAG